MYYTIHLLLSQGMFKSSITCLTHHQNIMFEPFSCLSVPIPRGDNNSCSYMVSYTDCTIHVEVLNDFVSDIKHTSGFIQNNVRRGFPPPSYGSPLNLSLVKIIEWEREKEWNLLLDVLHMDYKYCPVMLMFTFTSNKFLPLSQNPVWQLASLLHVCV